MVSSLPSLLPVPLPVTMARWPIMLVSLATISAGISKGIALEEDPMGWWESGMEPRPPANVSLFSNTYNQDATQLKETLIIFLFSCIVIECSQLNAPDNGFTTFSLGTAAPYSFTTTVTYGCVSGFGLSGGNRMQTCVSSNAGPGEWSGTAPTCEGIIILLN